MNKNTSHGYIDHAANAIARLRQSRVVQAAEMTGQISTEEATDEILRLNREARDESQAALRIAQEKHDPGRTQALIK